MNKLKLAELIALAVAALMSAAKAVLRFIEELGKSRRNTAAI